jgi:hypothetical protein
MAIEEWEVFASIMGVALVFLALGILLGTRLTERRIMRAIEAGSPRSGAVTLTNTVARIPSSGRDQSWQEPDWSRSQANNGPGAG